MNLEYRKIKHKSDFCKMLGFKMELNKETIRVYLETDNVPEKHKKRIFNAVKIQCNLDVKIAELEKKTFIDV